MVPWKVMCYLLIIISSQGQQWCGVLEIQSRGATTPTIRHKGCIDRIKEWQGGRWIMIVLGQGFRVKFMLSCGKQPVQWWPDEGIIEAGEWLEIGQINTVHGEIPICTIEQKIHAKAITWILCFGHFMAKKIYQKFHMAANF